MCFNRKSLCAPEVDDGSAYDKSNVAHATRDRRLVFTSNGYIGLAPTEAETGDMVCVLFGGETPFILRPMDEHWLLIGDCYIHGIMDGEAVADAEKKEKIRRTFEIW